MFVIVALNVHPASPGKRLLALITSFPMTREAVHPVMVSPAVTTAAVGDDRTSVRVPAVAVAETLTDEVKVAYPTPPIAARETATRDKIVTLVSMISESFRRSLFNILYSTGHLGNSAYTIL